MYVNRQLLDHHFRPKLKGLILDHKLFSSYYRTHPIGFISNSRSEFQGNDTHVGSYNKIAPTTVKRFILVVDDDPDIANLYKLSLERDGFNVHTFNDPLLALSNYRAGVYDLLLTDIKMPQMSGFELYQKIRQIDDRIKVCFITAFEEYNIEYKDLFPNLKEADCFIRKPIKLETLSKTVKSRLHYD